jgi:hypothetical protein
LLVAWDLLIVWDLRDTLISPHPEESDGT